MKSRLRMRTVVLALSGNFAVTVRRGLPGISSVRADQCRYLCSALPLRPQLPQFCLEVPQPSLEDLALFIQSRDVLFPSQKGPAAAARRALPFRVT